MSQHPSYLRVFLTFARNGLVRDMTFRSNFIIESISSMSWALMNLGFYVLIFEFTNEIGAGTGWGKYEFFVFIATSWLINSLVQTFFMPNADEFSEMIRTGGLDFALLKPIDTQFLISLEKMSFSSLSNFAAGLGLLFYALWQLTHRAVDPLRIDPAMVLLYPVYILCGVAILYSLMIILAATSIWLGRNTSLYDFWFYITNFSRYPMEIYSGRFGYPLQWLFTFIVPVLVVVNVPARIMARPLGVAETGQWWLPLFAVLATLASLAAGRIIFQRALPSYRSASS